MSKFEEVIRSCNSIEIKLDENNLREAEAMFITLCGALAKGTKYQMEVDRVANMYIEKFKKS